jgi:hypothetical protein
MYGSNIRGSKIEEWLNITMQEGQDMKNNAIRTSTHVIEDQQEQSASMRATTCTHKIIVVRNFKENHEQSP